MLSEGYQLYFGAPQRALDWFSGSLGYSYSYQRDGAISDWLMDLVSVGFSKQHRLRLKVLSPPADSPVRIGKVLTPQNMPKSTDCDGAVYWKVSSIEPCNLGVLLHRLRGDHLSVSRSMTAREDVAQSAESGCALRKIDTPAEKALRQLQANTAGRFQCGNMP